MTKPPVLNLRASVPGLTETVGTRQMARIIHDDPGTASPVRVVASNLFPDAAKFRDYIPSAAKVAQMNAYRGKAPPTTLPHTRQVVKHKGVDYMSAEDSAKRLVTRNQKLMETAKLIYAQTKDDRRRYEEACRLVDAATPDELASPHKRLVKAIQIAKAGPPMTKDKAKLLALEKVSRD